MRMFWIIKGHLSTNMDTMRGMYWSYFKRAWYDYEGQSTELFEEGFEEAYQERMKYPLEDHPYIKNKSIGK